MQCNFFAIYCHSKNKYQKKMTEKNWFLIILMQQLLNHNQGFKKRSVLAASNTALSAWPPFGVSWQMMRTHRRWHFGQRRQRKSLAAVEFLLGSGCRCCPYWGWVKVRSRCASLRWWWGCSTDRWPVTLSEGFFLPRSASLVAASAPCFSQNLLYILSGADLILSNFHFLVEASCANRSLLV